MNDNELINHLRILKNIIPKEEWVVALRAKLAFRMEMGRKNSLLDRDLSVLRGLFSSFSINQPKLSFNAICGVIIALGFIAAGGTITALAARQSSPGDLLYPVKLSLEKARLAVSLSEESKFKFQAEIADKRLQELKNVVDSRESAEQKAEKVTLVADNMQKQLSDISQGLPVAKPSGAQGAVAAAKAVSEKASRFSYALSMAKESLPSDILPKLDTEIAKVSEIAEQADMKAVEAMISNQDSAEIKKEEIAVKLSEIIADIQKQIDVRTEEPEVAGEVVSVDKMAIRAVLVNQTEQSRELLKKAKQAVAAGDLTGAWQIIKAVKSIETSVEEMAQNADRAAIDEIVEMNVSDKSAASSQSVESAK